jgi:hypothetical protein
MEERMKRIARLFMTISICFLCLTSCGQDRYPLIFLDPEVSIQYETGASGGDISYIITVDANPSSAYTGTWRGEYSFEFRFDVLVTNLTKGTWPVPVPITLDTDVGWAASTSLRIAIDGSGGAVDPGDLIYFSVRGDVLYYFINEGIGQYVFHGTETIPAY